jgi:hypothetical protein
LSKAENAGSTLVPLAFAVTRHDPSSGSYGIWTPGRDGMTGQFIVLRKPRDL